MKEMVSLLLIVCSALFAGCGKQSAASNNATQPPPPVQAEPFHGQVYKSVDGRNTLTVTSKDECDLTQDGTTLPCKYTKQADALRVIATVMGTPRVLYFRFVDQGLQANDGQILLAPQQYATAIAQLEKQRQEQEKKLEEEQMEKQRIAKEIADSKMATQTISTFTLASQPATDGFGHHWTVDRTLTLTDVSWKMKVPRDNIHDEILFSQIRNIYGLGEGKFTDYYNGNIPVLNNEFFIECYPKMVATREDQLIRGESPAEAQAIHDAMLNAYNSWKAKFPDAVLK